MTPYVNPAGALWKQHLAGLPNTLFQEMAKKTIVTNTWEEFFNLSKTFVMEKGSVPAFKHFNNHIIYRGHMHN